MSACFIFFNNKIGRGGTFGGIVEYGVERKVSKHSSLAATVAVGMPTGVKLKIRYRVIESVGNGERYKVYLENSF